MNTSSTYTKNQLVEQPAIGLFAEHSWTTLSALEYARWIPNNEYTIQQWEILASPTNNLLGGFLVKWEDKSTLSPALIRGKQKQVGKAFDEMIRLESGKIEE